MLRATTNVSMVHVVKRSPMVERMMMVWPANKSNQNKLLFSGTRLITFSIGPPKGRSYEFSAVSQLVSQSVSDAIPGNLVQEIF